MSPDKSYVLQREAYSKQEITGPEDAALLEGFALQYWNSIIRNRTLDSIGRLTDSEFRILCGLVEKDFPFRNSGDGVSIIGVQLDKVLHNQGKLEELADDLDCKFPTVILASILRVLGEPCSLFGYGKSPHPNVKVKIGEGYYKVDYRSPMRGANSNATIARYEQKDFRMEQEGYTHLYPVNLAGFQKLDELFLNALEKHAASF